MGRLIVEKFHKEAGEYDIDFVAGIEPDPPDPTPNAIFYIRMESTNRNTGRKAKTKPIWLSLREMVKLSVLMTMASQFWMKRLDKGKRKSKRRIEEFRKAWEQTEDAIETLEL